MLIIKTNGFIMPNLEILLMAFFLTTAFLIITKAIVLVELYNDEFRFLY